MIKIIKKYRMVILVVCYIVTLIHMIRLNTANEKLRLEIDEAEVVEINLNQINQSLLDIKLMLEEYFEKQNEYDEKILAEKRKQTQELLKQIELLEKINENKGF